MQTQQQQYGIDIGYGYTKASNGVDKIICPSAIAPDTQDPLCGMFTNGVGHHVTIKTSTSTDEMLVGDLALASTSSQLLVARQDKPQRIHDILLLTAAYLLGAETSSDPSNKISVGVGLPLSYFRDQKDELREHLQQMTASVSVDGRKERHYPLR
jgi:plasmid segregation protein ParM